MVELEQVLDVLAESLDGAAQIHQMSEEAPLLGAIPELDSMAIVGYYHVNRRALWHCI